MSLRRDEAAAIQVVEAILVAVLVAGALIFFALSNHPAPAVATAANQGTLSASDALAVMKGNGQLQVLVKDALNYSSAQNESTMQGWRTNVTGYLPEGVHWSMRLFTGFGRLELLNDTAVLLTPAREVAGAHAFVNVSTGAGMSDPVLVPGDSLGWNFTTSQCNLTAPDGSSGVGVQPWGTVWLEGASTRNTIPDFALFGRWHFTTRSGSATACEGNNQDVDVGIAASSATAVPYSLELVVWNVY